MTDLLSQLQNATEGSRGLDYEIHEWLGWRDDDECGWFHEPTSVRSERTDWPNYTTSIDAKLPWENITLVTFLGDGRWAATHREPNGEPVHGEGNTEALARRSAALKAHESKAEAA